MSISLFGRDSAEIGTGWAVFASATTTTVIEAGGNSREIICVGAVNATAGALTWSLDVYDGTTSKKLVDTESIAARGRATFELPVKLAGNEYVRATASGSGINVFATYRTVASTRTPNT